MTTLKQFYRAYGFEVNRDDQKGIGNAAIEEQLKVIRAYLKQRLSIASSLDAEELDEKAVAYLQGAKGEIKLFLAEIQINSKSLIKEGRINE